MPEGTNYWARRPLSRRTAIRGAGVGFAGLAGAALIGCGGGDGDDGASEGGGTTATPLQNILSEGAGTTATATGADSTPVPADQVRVPPGSYDVQIPPSAAELNPLVNGRYGGTLLTTYLDPPHMDINRTLSCTVFTTNNYASSKVTRARGNATGHPFIIELEGDLAESWEANPDSTQFTFHIRPGIKTQNVEPVNGRIFDSEDIKLAMEKYKSGGTQADVFAQVASIETPDAETVVVNLSQPLADFPTNIAAWSFMWPRELTENDELRGQRSFGTGPYIQEEWTQKERSIFVKNPDYFEEGLPFLDRIITVVQNDTAALAAGFKTNNFFGWSVSTDEEAEQMLNDVDDMVYVKAPLSRGANVNGWHFQLTNPVFQDERVRRAINMGFDRVELDLARNQGDNQNPEGPFSNAPMPWSSLYDEYPTAAVNGQWYVFDPAQASQLLQAAGYSSTNKLAWEHVTWYDRVTSAEVIIPALNQNLPELEVTFRQVDNPTQVTMLSDRNFPETMGIVWGPPSYSMDQWSYAWWNTNGSLNYNASGNAEMDALLDQQRAEADPEARKEIWFKMWDIIHDQVWNFWWPEGLSRTAFHNYVLNYRRHGITGSWSCYNSDTFRSVWLDEGHKMEGQNS